MAACRQILESILNMPERSSRLPRPSSCRDDDIMMTRSACWIRPTIFLFFLLWVLSGFGRSGGMQWGDPVLEEYPWGRWGLDTMQQDVLLSLGRTHTAPPAPPPRQTHEHFCVGLHLKCCCVCRIIHTRREFEVSSPQTHLGAKNEVAQPECGNASSTNTTSTGSRRSNSNSR